MNLNKNKIAIMVGTRPEIIKMSPVIDACEERGLDYFIVDSGQHFSYNMSKLFFEELKLPHPKHSLGVTSKSPLQQGDHTGRMMLKIERVLAKEKPETVLVQGDTITVLASTLCGIKLGMNIGHVEAGLRSYDRSMPEEINRVLCDHLAHDLFAVSEHAKHNILKEGININNIHVTGNTIVDAVNKNLPIAEQKAGGILKELNLEKENYFLVTAHRQDNADIKHKMVGILNGLTKLYEETGIECIYPLHPRTKKWLNIFGLEAPKGVRMIEPVGFLEILILEKNAKMIITDSGGLQEEAITLGVPCITLRENTERPETIEAGANALVGTDTEKIFSEGLKMMSCKRNWNNPYGDGTTGKQIVDIIEKGE